ncbi:hypothetical protein K7X08_013779 [Anisodus acutangulus]|uniref:Cytochrome P450 n=1 Tax=Anisodus acutangulus TaxID=402998 RepID=A0A9Q1R3P3_9SOLA|nr:hypothetical protein K7X08_013779 [Anisodus acutangulus]
MEISYYILIFIFLYLLKNHLLRKFQNLPPSPFISFPIIGHLYLFNKPLHRTLAKISEKHGPLLFLLFGSRPVLLVSSPSLAEECFTKNDVVFANRPRLLAGKHLGYNYTTLVWASYGQHWRNLRRIATLEILSNQRIQTFADIRRDEVRALLQRLVRGKTSGGDSNVNVVDMKAAFFEMTMNILMMMIAGKQYYGDYSGEKLEESRRFKEIATETFQLSGATNIGDFVPMLNWIGVNKLEDKLNLLKEKRDKFMQDLIEEHKNSRNSNTMIVVLLSLQDAEPDYYTDEVIRGMAIVMLTAGTDTTASTMEWALSLLLNNPEALKKARKEIDTHLGESSRLLDDSDLAQLPYLHGQRDGFRLMPFGYGRRGCPGENLAIHVAGLALGSLIQCFEWERINEELVDMTGGPGLTMPKAIPLLAKCRPRQNIVNLLAHL